MKKIIEIVVLALFFLAAGLAVAGTVYDRDSVTMGVTGAARWTNEVSYASLQLARVWVESDLYATNVVTVKRVGLTDSGTFTQAVGSVICSAGAGSTATFTASYLKFGDKLDFSSFTSTNGVVIIEYIVQQH